jgi:hypothetical protein
MDMQKILLHEIVVPNYLRKILTTKSRMAKYFIYPKDEAIKQKNKYNSNRYQWKEHISSTKKKTVRLFDVATNEWVIKNNRVAGKEKWTVINGQHIYSGVYNEHTQGKIIKAIHAQIVPFLQGLAPIEKYPLYIECEIHDFGNDEISGDRWDVGNRGYPYCKVFDDTLQEAKIIPDDSYKYVVCPCHPLFFDITDTEEKVPKLIFKIYHVCQ